MFVTIPITLYFELVTRDNIRRGLDSSWFAPSYVKRPSKLCDDLCVCHTFNYVSTHPHVQPIATVLDLATNYWMWSLESRRQTSLWTLIVDSFSFASCRLHSSPFSNISKSIYPLPRGRTCRSNKHNSFKQLGDCRAFAATSLVGSLEGIYRPTVPV